MDGFADSNPQVENKPIQANARIIDFLAQGIKPNEVLSIVGCSPAYLNGLIKDPAFMAIVEEKAKGYTQVAVEEEIISNKYLSLEHTILKKLADQVQNAELRDNIRALEVVGARQDKIAQRKIPALANSNRTVNVNQVILNLPAHAMPEYTLNANSEVTTIDGKTMNPMTSIAVAAMFAQRQGLTGKEPHTIIQDEVIVEQEAQEQQVA